MKVTLLKYFRYWGFKQLLGLTTQSPRCEVGFAKIQDLDLSTSASTQEESIHPLTWSHCYPLCCDKNCSRAKAGGLVTAWWMWWGHIALRKGEC